jgi:hypothetical protein
MRVFRLVALACSLLAIVVRADAVICIVPGSLIDCDDGNPCTTDRCDLVRCLHTPVSGPACDDGKVCTENDRCVAGVCAGRACADDGFACTEDACGESGCTHRPVHAACLPASGCSQARCAPGAPGHDAAGCVSAECLTPPDPGPAREPCLLPGTALGCNDGDPCTADRCELGGCVHASIAGPTCDDGDPCTSDDRCAAHGCAGIPVACPDDGFACTDDVCVVDGCVSVPVDSRCVPTGQCTAAVCAPEGAHDPSGCVAGPARAEGEGCAEDGDACTLDVCGSAACLHEIVLQPDSCAPLRDAYRQALALGTLARELLTALGPDGPEVLRVRLSNVDAELAAVAAALAGRARGEEGRPILFDTPLRRRTRAALRHVARTRPRISGVLRAAARAEVRAQVGSVAARDVVHRTRRLLRGTRALAAELRRIRRLTAFFAR